MASSANSQDPPKGSRSARTWVNVVANRSNRISLLDTPPTNSSMMEASKDDQPSIIHSNAWRTGRSQGSFFLDISTRKEGDPLINNNPVAALLLIVRAAVVSSKSISIPKMVLKPMTSLQVAYFSLMVLDVGIHTDPLSGMFMGSGDAVLETSNDKEMESPSMSPKSLRLYMHPYQPWFPAPPTPPLKIPMGWRISPKTWKTFWKMDVNHTTTTIWWRLLHGVISTKEQIKSRTNNKTEGATTTTTTTTQWLLGNVHLTGELNETSPNFCTRRSTVQSSLRTNCYCTVLWRFANAHIPFRIAEIFLGISVGSYCFARLSPSSDKRSVIINANSHMCLQADQVYTHQSELAGFLTKISPSIKALPSPQEQWDQVKKPVKKITVRYGKKHTSWHKATLRDLQRRRNAFLRTKPALGILHQRLDICNKLISHLQEETIKIAKIRSGEDHYDLGSMKQITTDFYQNLFTTDSINQNAVDFLLQHVQPQHRIPDTHLSQPTQPFNIGPIALKVYNQALLLGILPNS
ncbi:hypothetical protein BC941DRAFT_519186 [Chlamydoabsidia padenii]|nr:hypothetical protein BC941DRAFT_519186 [Chlamydoabsidia padenii]